MSFPEVEEMIAKIERLSQRLDEGDSETWKMDSGEREIYREQLFEALGPVVRRMIAAGCIDVKREDQGGAPLEIYHPRGFERCEETGNPTLLISDLCPDHAMTPSLPVESESPILQPGGKALIEQHLSDRLRADLMTLSSLSRFPAACDALRRASLREKLLPIIQQLLDAFAGAGLLRFSHRDARGRSVEFDVNTVGRDESARVVLSGQIAHVSDPPPRFQRVA